MLSMCHSEVVIPSDAMLDASMRAIFDGILALEAEKSKLANLGINVTPFTGKGICLDSFESARRLLHPQATVFNSVCSASG